MNGRLLRILGVAFGLAVVVGSSIGAGILRTPGTVAAHLGSGPLALAAWLAGGLYALLGAAALADLATSLPRSGGLYVYAHRALGPAAGFAVGWADWFSNCASIAYGAVTVGEYAAIIAPSATVRVVAAFAILAFAALQMLGIRVSGRVQEVASFTKAMVFIVLIAALLLVAPAASATAAASPAPAFPSIIAIALALQLIVGAYDGWQSSTYFGGEIRDPERNLPRSMVGGVLIVMAVYLLMNAALVRVMPQAQLAASTLPAADAARTLLGNRTDTAIVFISLLSPLSLVSAVLLCAPRILYAMSIDGLVPQALAFVDRRGTPSAALAVSTAVALAFLAVGSFDAIASVFAFFAVTSYTGAFASLLVLRRREPGLPRPFRSWGYPWTTVLVLAGAVVLMLGLVVSAPRESFIALTALAASYPVFRIVSALRSRQTPRSGDSMVKIKL